MKDDMVKPFILEALLSLGKNASIGVFLAKGGDT
jgi:hypothetical protein